MQHLSLEELARLEEEGAVGEEALHLAGCDACRAELEAIGAQTRALGSLGEVAPPAVAWPALAARLRAEGLMAGRPTGAARARRALSRVAAAVALFAAGGLAGTRTGGSPAEVATAPAATVGEAEARLRATEAEYLRALARHAELSGAAPAGDALSRLAALEGIVLTTGAALEEAPADPVINGYHLMALGQREALLREIDATADEVWY